MQIFTMILFTKTKQFIGEMITAIAFVVVTCVLPVRSFAQTVTFSSANPAIPSSYINAGVDNQILYKASFIRNGGWGMNISQVVFTPTGTFATSDIGYYKFWYNTTDNFTSATNHNIILSTGFLSGFSYILENKPSTPKSYTVRGTSNKNSEIYADNGCRNKCGSIQGLNSGEILTGTLILFNNSYFDLDIKWC